MRLGPQVDRVGQRFGSVVVLSLAGTVNRVTHWNVRCDCGAEKTIRNCNLPATKSCGCAPRAARKQK